MAGMARPDDATDPPTTAPTPPPVGESTGRRKRRWPLVLVIVVIVLVVLITLVGCLGGLWLFIQRNLRTSGIYKQAIERVSNTPAVTERIGTPLEPRWVITGEVHIRNASGEADMSIPVVGPDGTCRIHVVGTRSAEQWTIDALEVEFQDGSMLDLSGNGPPLDPAGDPNEHNHSPPHDEAAP